MKIGIHNGSGLGDILMALPLLYGLRDAGHEVYGVGNESTRSLYDFLAREKAIAGIKIYQSHSPLSWRREIRDLDIFLLVGYFGYGLNPLGLSRFLLPLLSPFLRFFQGVKKIIYMNTIDVETLSPKTPRITNRPLSYIRSLEYQFGLNFNSDSIFLDETILSRAREKIRPLLSERGLEPGKYGVLYPATGSMERNMPEFLINRIAEYCFEQEIKLVVVGDSMPKNFGLDKKDWVVDWSGRRDFGELVGLFSLSRMVFSIDGGLLYLALTSRCPVVSFWGATIPDSRVVSNHPYHHFLCRYLPFQPYEGESISERERDEAFNFSKDEIAKAVEEFNKPLKQISDEKVGIIVPNYCHWQDTVECLESLRKIRHSSRQIIVCDSGSPNDSWPRLIQWAQDSGVSFICCDEAEAVKGGEENFSQADIVLVRILKNRGYAASCNVGLRYLLNRPEFGYGWLLNNDTVVEPLSLTYLLERMREKPRAGICGSTVVYYDSPTLIQARGGLRFNPLFGTGAQIGFGEKKEMFAPETLEKLFSGIYGASALVSRKFIEEIGLMDENYFIYYEEFDWAMRARGRYCLAYAPKSLIFHKEGKTTAAGARFPRKRSLFADYYQIRNRIIFTKKFFPWALPTVCLGVMAAILDRLIRGEFVRARALFGVLLGVENPPGVPSGR